MFNFEQDYGVFTDFVQNCNRVELSKCKDFIEKQIAALDDKLLSEYVEGLKKFNSEQKQKIIKLLNEPASDKKSKRAPDAKPCGFADITYNGSEYSVPQYINVGENDCFSAGSPTKKDWLGSLKTKEDKKVAQEMYGAAKVIADNPGYLKTLAEKGLVRQQQNGQWPPVPASQF